MSEVIAVYKGTTFNYKHMFDPRDDSMGRMFITPFEIVPEIKGHLIYGNKYQLRYVNKRNQGFWQVFAEAN